ncbi:MAG: HDOD domain-containing protein [Gammaproteobacteria bacterium]|nr:HDOD domain-containing protein [Gammaproteobacteria bacterium]MDH5727661.1 HDOD domain-containing protein [Gammaproteobacteria bacterium]
MSDSSREIHSLRLVRVPIFSNKNTVSAYALKFIKGHYSEQNGLDEKTDLTPSVFKKINEQTYPKLFADTKLWMPFSRYLGKNARSLPLNGRQLIIELLPDTPSDRETVDQVTELSRLGYQIAAPGKWFIDNSNSIAVLAKIAVLNYEEIVEDNMLAARIAVVSSKQLLRHVNDEAAFQLFQSSQLTSYTGSFYLHPPLQDAESLPKEKLHRVQLLAKIQNPSVDFIEVRQALSQDQSITNSLLEYINSPVFKLESQVSSTQQALGLLGLNVLKQWLMVAIVGEMVTGNQYEPLRVAFIRARMCELIARKMGSKKSGRYFLVGLLSGLEMLLAVPTEKAIELMGLSDKMKGFLLDYEGVIGSTLGSVIAFEQGDWENAKHQKVSDATMQKAYLNAIVWSKAVIEQIEKS